MTTLLVCDDDKAFREVLMPRMLQPLGFELVLAETLGAAKRRMRENPDIGFIFLDLRLPDSPDGVMTLEAIKEFREINPSVAVAVLTGDPDEKLRQVASHLGADAYRVKTELASQKDMYVMMRDAIENMAEKGVPATEAMVAILQAVNRILTE